MANTTVGGVTFHDGANSIITENSARKESVLAVMPLYSLDADQTDVFDYGGVTKTITLSGSYVADSVANLKTWIDSAEALQNGQQDVDNGYPLDFVDDLRGSIKVKVLNFDSTFIQSEPTRITWTLKLVQSSENA